MGMIKNYRARKVERHPGPWSVEIRENFNPVLGYPKAKRGGQIVAKYRATVMDANGAPVRILHGPSVQILYKGSERYAARHGVELLGVRA